MLQSLESPERPFLPQGQVFQLSPEISEQVRTPRNLRKVDEPVKIPVPRAYVVKVTPLVQDHFMDKRVPHPRFEHGRIIGPANGRRECYIELTDAGKQYCASLIIILNNPDFVVRVHVNHVPVLYILVRRVFIELGWRRTGSGLIRWHTGNPALLHEVTQRPWYGSGNHELF